MPNNRLEAFSDGVLAIIITIMVLAMEAPEGKSWRDLGAVIPTFIGYIISYTYLCWDLLGESSPTAPVRGDHQGSKPVGQSFVDVFCVPHSFCYGLGF